jgi:glycosyltransferase involved in cell wall biosynthesis
VRSSPEALATTQESSSQFRLAGVKRVAIVPAYNEAACIASVIEEIRAADPDVEIVVVDDGSTDATAPIAVRKGAEVVRLPYNLGIGGAVQTGYQYARAHGFDIAIQIDGDGQHDPAELPKLLEPILRDQADLVVGSRFAGATLGGYRGPILRRIGMQIFARMVSLIARQRVTDTTSGFRAANRRAIRLFAADYPHDYPEVEATVLVHHHKLTMVEVPVAMRTRTSGRSSINAFRSAYYMIKVSLALFVGLFRRYATPLHEE